ncbi:MAG: VPLPA-CTERM sorting domain-containing protein [Pseudomonadota bacterium]
MTAIAKLAAICTAVFCMSAPALSATMEFIPPNDTTGQVWSTNTVDGWDSGRGIGFSVTEAVEVDSLGVFHDLTGIDVSYGLYEISSGSGNFSRSATLRSGSSTITTSGLDWVDFAVAPLTLAPGTNYLLEFSIGGPANQNFFYNNGNVAWSQSVFTSLDGTLGDSFSNFVVGAFRLNGDETSVVPLPGGLVLMVGAFAAFGALRGRRRS